MNSVNVVDESVLVCKLLDGYYICATFKWAYRYLITTDMLELITNPSVAMISSLQVQN